MKDERQLTVKGDMMQDKIFVTRSSMPSYEEYIQAIKPLWNSHWLTNMGEYHQKLEQELVQYLKIPRCSLMSNGHMALELAIQAFGFQEGTEIITTPFTFISTTHAIVRNHIEPVFCDVKLSDGTIDEACIENLITEKTVAIVPVHIYGNVCNITEIQKIADKYNLKVIYDAAHAFGIEYQNKGIGNYGDASIFSFHATKVFHTIEGGAVAFSDHKLYEKLYNLKNFGIRGEELVTDVGANAKMNEFSAIMGLCNLKRMNLALGRRKERYDLYIEGLKNVKGLRLFQKNSKTNNNYAYFPILVEGSYQLTRDGLYDFLKENGIFTRKYFCPLTSDQACFKNKYKHVLLDRARELSSKVLVLPLYEELDIKELNRIIQIVQSMGG